MAHATAVAAASVAAAASSAAAAPGAAGEPPWYRSPQVLDDPAGVRSRLEDLGIAFQLFYNQFLAWKPHGGAVSDARAGYSGSYDFFTLIDLEELAGWPALDLLLRLKGQYDRNLNDDVGALSDPIDDADLDDPIYLSELWIDWSPFTPQLDVRAGVLEQQTAFDRNAFANSEDLQFMATFLDNDPVVPLPNGPGAVVVSEPWPWLALAVGAVAATDRIPDGGFFPTLQHLGGPVVHVEISLRNPIGGVMTTLPGRYRVGAFWDGRRRPDWGAGESAAGGFPRSRGHLGGYLSFDQLAVREGPESDQGLGLFARAGYADGDTSRIAWFWSLGLQYRGLLPTRDDDVLGLGGFQAIGSGAYRRAVDPSFDRESGVELYYRIAVLPWLAVTPDFQYIVDPGATGDHGDAVVVALRFRVSF